MLFFAPSPFSGFFFAGFRRASLQNDAFAGSMAAEAAAFRVFIFAISSPASPERL